MIINNTGNINHQTAVAIKKDLKKEDGNSHITDKKMPEKEETPDFMKMSSFVSDWKYKEQEAKHTPGLGFEVASAVGGAILGFNLFCAMEGNPIGLLAGLAVGGAIGTMKCFHDIKKQKELNKEVEANRETAQKYEKSLKEEEIRQEKIKAEEEKKHQEELQKEKELKEAEKQKEQEEIKQKKEAFLNILKEDINKFKEKNNILFETDIISTNGWGISTCESHYTIGAADVIDVNQDGEAVTNTRPIGGLRDEIRYKEPTLTMPYEDIDSSARKMKKGIITSDDMKGLAVEDFGVSLGTTGFQSDYEIQENERSIDLMAKNLMPDMPGVRGALNILDKKFVIYKPKELDVK